MDDANVDCRLRFDHFSVAMLIVGIGAVFVDFAT